MTTKKDIFLEIKGYFKRLSDQMCEVTEAYLIWHVLVFSKSTVVSGKEIAEKNVATLNLYKGFFIPLEHILTHAFIIGICKFFDQDTKSLSLNNLIKIIKKNSSILTAETFLEVHPNQFDAEKIRREYSPIKQKDIDEINGIVNKNKILIEKLKKIRNKQSAHNNIKKTDGEIVPNEIELLIKDIRTIFNKLSVTFDQSKTIWKQIEDESTSDTKFLLENLQRGEKQRLIEIDEKYK